jgi:hypothetical protein
VDPHCTSLQKILRQGYEKKDLLFKDYIMLVSVKIKITDVIFVTSRGGV